MSRIHDEHTVAKGHKAFLAIHESWAAYASNLYGWAGDEESPAVSVLFRQRGPGDWVGVAKRDTSDRGPEVVFGTAFDFVSCVMAVNAAMSANRWKVDEPWVP